MDLINYTGTAFSIKKPSQTFEKFYTSGNDMLLNLRNQITDPNDRKQARTWPIGQVAKIVGVSRPTLNKLLQNNNIPGLLYEERKNSKKSRRVIKKFTLEAINCLRDLAGTRYARPNNSKPFVIAVSNLKGGVGKTVTSVELGKKIALEGLRALLLDFDPQGSATLISSGLIPDLELTYEQTITDILISQPENIENVILKTHFEGFDIIPANLAIQDCDLSLPQESNNNSKTLGSPFTRLSKALKTIKSNYDVILIDCSPNVGYLTLNALIACNALIVPIPPSMNDYSSFIMYTAMLKNMFDNIPDKSLDYFRILLTKHNGKKEALEMESVMRTQFGGYVLSQHMCDSIEVPRAANDIGSIYDIEKPRGSRESFNRAITHLNDVNLEVINNLKEIWEQQSNDE